MGMKAIVTIHSEGSPHPMLAELVTARRIDRVFVISGKAPFAFEIAVSDSQKSDDVIRIGRFVVIWSTAGLSPYVGRIDQIEDQPDRGTIEISGNSLATILYERQLPLETSFSNQTAGFMALQMLALVNNTNSTGIWPKVSSDPGTPIRGTFDASSAILGRALDKLAAQTGDEWWMEYQIDRQHIEAYLSWGRDHGVDKSYAIHFQEGVHFVSAQRVRDALGFAQSVAAVGGGAPVSERSAAVSSRARTSGQGRGTFVDAASEPYKRTTTLPVSLTRESVQFLPLDNDIAVLSDAARRALEIPLVADEEFRLIVNAIIDWRTYQPGDYVQGILHSMGETGVSRRLQILATQPAEYKESMKLRVRVRPVV